MDFLDPRAFAIFLVLFFSCEVSANTGPVSIKKIGGIFHDPFLMRGKRNSGGGGRGPKTGFLPDLLNQILTRGTYKFIQPGDGHYGMFDNNTGSWDGLMGMAANDEVEMIAADLTMTAKRGEVLDFTVPFLSAHATVLLQKERKKEAMGHGHKRKYQSVYEMLGNPHFKFMVVEGGSTHMFLKSSMIAYQRQIFQRIQNSPNTSLVQNYKEGVDRLLDSDGHDLGLIAESPAAMYRTKIKCRLYTVGNLGERYYGLAVKRNGSSAENMRKLSQKILQLQEGGIMQALIHKWFERSDKCFKKSKKEKDQLLKILKTKHNTNGTHVGGKGSHPHGHRGHGGGEGACKSMKSDVSDIKATVHDLKREIDKIKATLEN